MEKLYSNQSQTAPYNDKPITSISNSTITIAKYEKMTELNSNQSQTATYGVHARSLLSLGE